MKELTYICDDCEDTEKWNEVLKVGFHCECGGHLHLVRNDNFVKAKKYSDCKTCAKKNTDDCVDCIRNV